MLSTLEAERAWKVMTRSFPARESSDESTRQGDAGAAAYATLLGGETKRAADAADTEPWLLLREQTRGRTASQLNRRAAGPHD